MRCCLFHQLNVIFFNSYRYLAPCWHQVAQTLFCLTMGLEVKARLDLQHHLHQTTCFPVLLYQLLWLNDRSSFHILRPILLRLCANHQHISINLYPQLHHIMLVCAASYSAVRHQYPKSRRVECQWMVMQIATHHQWVNQHLILFHYHHSSL